MAHDCNGCGSCNNDWRNKKGDMYDDPDEKLAKTREKLGKFTKPIQKERSNNDSVVKSMSNFLGIDMNQCGLRFKKLHASATIPQYQTPGSAGFDFHAVVQQNHGGSWNKMVYNAEDNTHEFIVCIEPKSQVLIKTGLAVAIPKGYELQVRPRSGLALKHQITITNSPGTVDESFRGEIGIILMNLGNDVFTVRHGDRIAQGVVNAIKQFPVVEVDELDDTERGNGGFGSTGV